MSDDEASYDASESEDEGTKKKKKSPAKKTSKKTEKTEKKTPTKKKSSNKENEKPLSTNKKKDKDAPKALSDKEAGPRLVEYMREQNRPFNVIGLFENLKQTIKKATLQKLLDKYSEQGIFTCKTNGKQKLYFITQDPNAVCSDEVLAQKDAQIKQLEADLKEQTALATKATQEWNELKNEPTTDELTKMVAEKEKNVATMKAKLSQLKAGNVQKITSEEMSQINAKFTYFFNQWKKRKKTCVDCIADVYEGAEDGVSREDRLSSLGLDTDEDNNIDIKTYEALVLPVKKGSIAVGCKRFKTS